ncbi:hypothetical protein ACMD2_23388 [Ananas comosus]|uniref:Uncharacterized protein n=1 Tax=Ananas comosus TaxID=4615 RepID=A0A199W699_ANACO|nr:hypothetical protein ACMD2_23388 [Ananas comosus]
MALMGRTSKPGIYGGCHRTCCKVSACRRPCSPFGALPAATTRARATRTSAKQCAQREDRTLLTNQGTVNLNGGEHRVQHEPTITVLTSRGARESSDHRKSDRNAKQQCWNQSKLLTGAVGARDGRRRSGGGRSGR